MRGIELEHAHALRKQRLHDLALAINAFGTIDITKHRDRNQQYIYIYIYIYISLLNFARACADAFVAMRCDLMRQVCNRTKN